MRSEVRSTNPLVLSRSTVRELKRHNGIYLRHVVMRILLHHNVSTMLGMTVTPNVRIYRLPRDDGAMHLPPQEPAVPQMVSPRHKHGAVSFPDFGPGKLDGAGRVGIEWEWVGEARECFDELAVVAIWYLPRE